MFKILIKTYPFFENYTKVEIEKYTKSKINVLTKGLYEIELNSEKDVFDFTYNIVFYSRTIKRIYLKLLEFETIDNIDEKNIDLSFIKKDLKFRVSCEKKFGFDNDLSMKKIGAIINDKYENLSVDLEDYVLDFRGFTIEEKNYLGLDLAGFKLSQRDYKIHNNYDSINSLIVDYTLYVLGIDKLEGNYSLIDPNANLGDLIIEASYFNPRNAIHLRKRYELPVLKLFDFRVELPKQIEDKTKYIAIVQDSKIFKLLRENLSYTNQKIKLSKYEHDWLDVKFKKGEVDYVLTQLANFPDKELQDNTEKELIYQAEFIAKKKIGIISKREINQKYLDKYKLKIEEKKEILNGQQKYLIYVISKNKEKIVRRRKVIVSSKKDIKEDKKK